MNANPSPRQADTLRFLVAHFKAHGYAPTFEEIAAHLGIRSRNAVNDHLDGLERKGFIQRTPMKSRAIRILREEEQP
jgi:repressor LexA